MNSLELMYQMGLKNSAAMALPQQLQTEQQTALEKLRGDQLSNDQTAAMNPLNQMYRQGEINQQGATLANTQAQHDGFVGNSQTLLSNGAVDQATQQSRIDVKKSDNANQMGVNQVQTIARDGQIAGMVAASLGNFPKAAHQEVAHRLLQQYGVPEGSPLYHAIEQLPPEKVAEGLGHIGSEMTKTSAEYIKSMAVANANNASSERQSKGNNDATRYVADTAANARIAAAEARADRMFETMNLGQKISHLSDLVADGTATDKQIKQLTHLENLQKTTAAARVPALPNDMTGNRSQAEAVTQPTDDFLSGGGGGVPAPAPAAPPTPSAPPVIRPNQQAIDHLKSHPELRDAFDAKYGKGTSTAILGK